MINDRRPQSMVRLARWMIVVRICKLIPDRLIPGPPGHVRLVESGPQNARAGRHLRLVFQDICFRPGLKGESIA